MTRATVDAATGYRARGWCPIPLPARSKAPIGGDWQNLRLEAHELPRHFSNGANVGLLTGAPSGGLMDVDLDAPEAVALAPRFLPPTGRVHGRPGKQASHWWYLTDDPPPTTRYLDVDGAKGMVLVELRGTGGQTVVPPSVHPSGEAIRWVSEGEPAFVPITELRASIARLAACALCARHWSGQGSRHQCSLALAGWLARHGFEEEKTVLFVVAEAAEAGDEEAHDRGADVRSTYRAARNGRPTTGGPTLIDLVGERVVKRAAEWLGIIEERWEPPIPFQACTLTPFPIGALPSWLRMFVEQEAEATQTPPDLAALLCLSVIGAAIAGRVEVVARDGFVEPVNLFVVVALGPGNRKSVVFREVVRPLEEFEAEGCQRLAPEIAAAESGRKILEGRLQRAQGEAARACPEDRARLEAEAATLARELAEASPPKRPRLVCDDVSPERLASLLCEHGGRMAVMAPEGDIFDIMSGRYSTAGASNFGVFLRGHAGDTLRVDRVGRAPEHLISPALTLGLAVQPEVLQGLFTKPGFRGRGLLARFLYSVPESTIGRRRVGAPPLPQATKDTYQRNIRALLALPAGVGQNGEPMPHRITLDSGARGLLHQIEAEIEPRLALSGDLGAIADWAGKLVGAILRIAGILHVASCCEKTAQGFAPITRGMLSAAAQIGEYLTAHAKVAFNLMGSDPTVEDARHVVDWLAERGMAVVAARDIFNALRGRFRRMSDLAPVLTLLVDHGYLRPRPNPVRQGAGRRPSPTYDVSPHITQNPQNAPPSAPLSRSPMNSADSANCADAETGDGWGEE